MTIDLQRDPLRQLSRVVELSPDVRLGQLMAHLGFLGECHLGRGLGEMENDELMTILKLHEEELRSRLSSSPTTYGPITGLKEMVAV